ncbi:Multiple ankyrin repeats single kh domain [Mycena venus]|uniref:Multiple ankyrin repeats single kh domain n=1 Tax=Mycena venus TaxID=2733690 RepID=A0A8H7D7X8_9AGAR|nr:Multiple ankyrin repeats single kh domain [Mycena venus]
MSSCITANPDITGIGVRAAIYAQNLLCFAPVVANLWDGRISSDEMKGIKDQSIGMLAIAFSILISTIVQAKTSVAGQPINGFHAAVILDLSWMNNTSTWIWFLLYAHYLSKTDEGAKGGKGWMPGCPACRLEEERNPIPATRSAWVAVIFSKSCKQHRRESSFFMPILHIVDRAWDLFSHSPVLIIGSLHLSLMSAIGIWLWLHPREFGSPLTCVPTLTIVGGAVPFSSHALQIFSLMMYFLLLVPGVNLLPPILFFLAFHLVYNWSRERYSPFWKRWDDYIARIRVLFGPNPKNKHSEKEIHTGFLVVGLVLLAVINIILIGDIERTLTRNNQSDANNVWGFGQVLSVLLLVVPLRDAWNAFRDVQEGRLSVQHQFQQMLREELTATPIFDRLQVLINRGADPRTHIKGTTFPNSLRLVGYFGRKDMVEFLGSNKIPDVKRLSEADPTGGYGTFLQAASANGQMGVVEELLKLRAADVNILGGHYGTAFCAACANGRVEVAKLLVQHEANVTLYEEKFGPPLHIAALTGQIDVIQWLLAPSNMNINMNSKWGNYGTALDVAVLGNQAEAAKELRKKGAETVCNIALSANSHFAAHPMLTTTLLPLYNRL